MGEAVVLVTPTTAALWAWACARGQRWVAVEAAASWAKLLSKDAARRIGVNIAKLPELLRKSG